MYTNFLLGQLKITDAAKAKLRRTPLDLVARHAINDHGYVTQEETEANKKALYTADKIISRYLINPQAPEQGHVIVVTHEAWDETTVFLDEEL